APRAHPRARRQLGARQLGPHRPRRVPAPVPKPAGEPRSDRRDVRPSGSREAPTRSVLEWLPPVLGARGMAAPALLARSRTRGKAAALRLVVEADCLDKPLALEAV